jgi:ribosomal protein S18 acetylase RimI-like enzyme
MSPSITYSEDLDGVDWVALKAALAADCFDNGRSPEQLRRSFENSSAVALARRGEEIIGTGRVLSDEVSNAYLLDVWTHSRFRRRGIAREMIRRLSSQLGGQHLYLQADAENTEFYRRLGFREQPIGMSKTIGRWLVNDGSEVSSRH